MLYSPWRHDTIGVFTVSCGNERKAAALTTYLASSLREIERLSSPLIVFTGWAQGASKVHTVNRVVNRCRADVALGWATVLAPGQPWDQSLSLYFVTWCWAIMRLKPRSINWHRFFLAHAASASQVVTGAGGRVNSQLKPQVMAATLLSRVRVVA